MLRAARPSVRNRLRGGVAIGLALALAVLSGCKPQPSDQTTYRAKPRPPSSSGEYSSTRLILRRTDGGFEVVSSTPSLGGVTRPDVAQALPEILEGKQRLYRYVARNRGGALVAQGHFVVPLTARATFTEANDPERIHHVELDDPSRIVRVAIPYAPDLATVEIRALVPDKGRSYETWETKDAGSIRIESPPEQKRGESR